QDIFSPIITNRLDSILQNPVEMGVGAIRPVITRYTQNAHYNRARIRTYNIKAEEQCDILTLTLINPPTTLEIQPKNCDHNCQIVFADETCGSENYVEKLDEIAHIPNVAILIGPEGGYHSEEKETLHSLPFVTPLSLGPRILRSDTAAVAAMA
ncbi:16S rRNA (uracil(1498)-N(3))-methyltransferase, partial [Candidatus Liberibacter asiaticus]